MALRKPTRAAWAVNRLARADPGSPGRLAALAAELRAAAEAADGRKLRELSARRGELVDDLASRALAAAGVADPPPALRSEVEDTLTSALADPETAARFASATLTRPAEWSGFAPFTPPDTGETAFASPADAPAENSTAATADPDAAATAGLDAAATAGADGEPAATEAASPARPGAPPARSGTARPRKAAPRRAEQAPGRAGVPDELAARRRKAADDAERMMASAAQAATAAVTREEELEAEVRDLEERLTRARAELATARTRARRAESAERKARQRLGQHSHPG
jgi:hypothetical protein